mgnify:CR=1 FL=1
MSNGTCALCTSPENLNQHQVMPENNAFSESMVTLCQTCIDGIGSSDAVLAEHWRCLSDSMWSHERAVQVLAWRLLKGLTGAAWADNLLEMLYLEDSVLAWAKAGLSNELDDDTVIHNDSNGSILVANDNVTIIKDLPVKGSSMVVKRGTVVRKISLVMSNADHIEGRVDGQKVVIVTKFVKKS